MGRVEMEQMNSLTFSAVFFLKPSASKMSENLLKMKNSELYQRPTESEIPEKGPSDLTY